MLQDFYLRIILPIVNYDLILWGPCCNPDILDFLERLHCRVVRIIFSYRKIRHLMFWSMQSGSLFVFTIN